MTASRQVVWLIPGYREYRRAIIELTASALSAHGVTLRVAHARSALHTTQGDECSTDPPSLPLASIRAAVGGRELLLSTPPPAWASADLLILPEAVGYLPTWGLLFARRAVGRKTAMFGHGTDFKAPNSNGVLERARSKRMRHLDWWFSYNARSSATVAKHGFPEERISEVGNALDTRVLRERFEQYREDELLDRRRFLGVGAGPVGLFMGALHREKHLAHVVACADGIRAQLPDFELIIVGDGPERALLDELRPSRPWLHVLPGDTSTDRAIYWRLASVALYPAWAGLALVEALAMGVPPVISSHFPHPPEAEYVVDGHNGLVVDDERDPRRYASAVSRLMADEARMESLRSGARTSADGLSAEAMAERFALGILAALDAPRRG